MSEESTTPDVVELQRLGIEAVNAEQILDLGNRVSFAVVIQTGRPVDGNGEVRVRYGSVTERAEGLIARVTNYPDIDEASAAAERLAEERE
jgi:ketosteroid isomerase-like protein